MDILRNSIIVAIIGILFLAFISLYVEPREVKISSITTASVDSPVKIVGTIVEDKEYPTVRILTINDGSEILVPLFFEPPEKIREGNTVSVCGKVHLYKGELEVIPSSPRDIKIIP